MGVEALVEREQECTMTQVHLAEIIDTDDSPKEAFFRKTVFYILIDNVVVIFTLHFNAVKRLSENFDFLWKYPTMSESVHDKKKSERVSTHISY